MLAAGLSIAADTPERLFREAVESFSSQRYSDAEPKLREAVRQRPRWFDAQFLLGATLVSLGRAGEAVGPLEIARKLNPAHLDCAKLLAAEYLGLDRQTEAIAVVRPLLARADEELLLLAIEALQVRNDAGDSAEALRLCTRGLSRYPRSARLLAWHGFQLREQGSLGEARRSLEKALVLAPGDVASQSLLADVHRREGRLDEALALFDKVLATAPGEEEAVIGKSRTLAAMGDLPAALRSVRLGAAVAPGTARFRLELSQLYAKLGEPDAAAREAAEFRRLRGSERTVPLGLRSNSR